MIFDKIKEHNSKFTEMVNELASRDKKKLFKPLKINHISSNAPCICYYATDKTYNRAIIEKVNYIDASATIRYIDYGNEETVSFSK